MARGGLEVADVFRHFGPAFRDQHGASLSSAQRHAMTAIERCRTAALGGHVEQCGDCGHQRVAFNSCRNRNCPKCQGLARAQWLEDRQAELLDVPYFHVVFTVPAQIEVIAFQGAIANPPPAFAFSGSRWRDCARRQELDPVPARVLPAGTGFVEPVPGVVPALPGPSVRRR